MVAPQFRLEELCRSSGASEKQRKPTTSVLPIVAQVIEHSHTHSRHTAALSRMIWLCLSTPL